MLSILLFLIAVINFRAESHMTCYNAFQCVGDQLVTSRSWDWILSYGYKSSSSNQSSIDSAGYALCDGAFSCIDSSLIKGGPLVYCYGSNACSSSYISTNGEASVFHIYCGGSNGCIQSDLRIEDGASISCEGDQSCANSNINIVDIEDRASIYAEGSYSMMYATINTPNSNALININFYGYMSGYGANITCESTDMCRISCYNNACYSTYIHCKGNCIITNQSYSATLPINNIIPFNESAFELIYNSQTITTAANTQCIQPNAVKYDNYEQNYQGVDIINNGGSICCRGHSSCSDINKIQLDATNEHAIVCSGMYGCYSVGNIISNAPILCDGVSSCEKTNITINNNMDIYCFGTGSCKKSNISGAKNIYCSGYRSCYDTLIQSSGGINVYLLGYESGFNMTIHCNVGDECKTFCEGDQSCEGVTVYKNNPTQSPADITTLWPSSSLTSKPSLYPTVFTIIAFVMIMMKKNN